MKAHTKQILEIAAVFLVALIIVDSLLAAYPVLTLLALCSAFIVLSGLMLDILFQLTPRKFARPVQPQRRDEDELVNLENITRQAFDPGHPAASAVLSQRIRSMALRAAEYRMNLSESQLSDMAQNQTALLELLGDRQLVSAITTDDSIAKPADKRMVEDLLNLMEASLS